MTSDIVMVQVCIPVEVAGQAVTSVSLLSLHKSDMRLLQTAAKLGPLTAEAAQAVGEALAEEAQEEEAQQASTSGDAHAALYVICLAVTPCTRPSVIAFMDAVTAPICAFTKCQNCSHKLYLTCMPRCAYTLNRSSVVSMTQRQRTVNVLRKHRLRQHTQTYCSVVVRSIIYHQTAGQIPSLLNL